MLFVESLVHSVLECDVNQTLHLSSVTAHETTTVATRPLNLPLATGIYRLRHMSRSVGKSHSNFPPKRLQHLGRINVIIYVKSIEAQKNATIIDIDIFVNCNWVDTRWQVVQYIFTHKQYIEQHK
jgi:hypothetical protein